MARCRPPGTRPPAARTGTAEAITTPMPGSAGRIRRSGRKAETACAPPARAENSAPTGLASGVTNASATARPVRRRWSASALPTAGMQTERERQPSREQACRRRHSEPQRAEPAVLPEAPAGQRLEQRGGDGRRDRRDELRGEQGGERREQHAVAGDVVARVPPVVPDAEPLSREQLRAQQVRRQVLAARFDQHVGERDHARGERGQDPLEQPHAFRVARARGVFWRRGRLRLGADGRADADRHGYSSRKFATRSTKSLRSSHGQCPASDSRSSFAPRRCAA